MTDIYNMYNNEKDEEQRASTKATSTPIKIDNDAIVLEANGKKTTVVSKAEHDKLKAELAESQKQVRALATKVQNMERFLTKFSKDVSSKLNYDRFN